MSAADQLQQRIEQAKRWPPPGEQKLREQLELWAAFRESDADRIRPANWDPQRAYVIDPLPERIPQAFADLLYGEDPRFVAAAERGPDQGNLDRIVDDNDIPSELHWAVQLASSEGEVWWHAFVDRDAADVPIIEWVSRRHVYPLLRGRQVAAVAFITELDGDGEDRWRLVEIQERGHVRNLLYRAVGREQGIGQPQPLKAHPDTADLPESFDHGFDLMLAGRVLNRPARGRVGRSDYAGVRDLLFALNEASSIGVENARMTLKRRVVVPQRYLDENGNFPAGAEVLIAPEVDTDPDKPGERLVQVEWEFDATAWVTWDAALTDKILTRTRVAPQLVGRHTEQAQSAPALRARLIDSVLAAQGKARYWDDEVPKAMLALQLLDNLPEERGGFGRPWASPGEPPAVERRSIIPEDLDAEVARHAQAVAAEIESRETAIRALHPDWSDEQVADELDRIRSEIEPPQLPLTDDESTEAG